MTDDKPANSYPLDWPAGWPRKRGQQATPFTYYGREITVATANLRLKNEMRRLGVRQHTLSTNLPLARSGEPLSELPRGTGTITDCGAAIYFSFKGRATVMACDKYRTVAGNIAALAAHIEALRKIERHGVGTIEQALAGYKALPVDTAADWRTALFGLDKPKMITPEMVETAFRTLARQYHPDVYRDDGGKMAWLNRVREYAYAEIGGA